VGAVHELGERLLSSLNHQTVEYHRDKLYEQLAKPGNEYSVYSNKHYQGENILEKYLIEQIFKDKASGFYALGLVSISGENHPILVVRGCGNWGAFENFPTEFVPYKDIPDVVMAQSDWHFKAAKKTGVIEWLRNKAFTVMKPDLVGQSLGGKVGQQLTVEVPEYIHCLVTFNSIGISLEEFEKYQGSVEIFHYINPADLVPYVLGEKFLPGTVFQVCNLTIKKPDLLGQHNKLVLNHPATQIKQVEIEKFFWVRDFYKLVKAYGKSIKTEIEDLTQAATQDAIEDDTSPNFSSRGIGQQFDNSSKIIQQGFREITQAFQQNWLEDVEGIGSDKLLQDQVRTSIKFIQKEIKILRKAVQDEIKVYSINFDGTSQQEIDNSAANLQHELDNLLGK
jgi:hypothetical protein